jgi:hypothetical protein
MDDDMKKDACNITEMIEIVRDQYVAMADEIINIHEVNDLFNTCSLKRSLKRLLEDLLYEEFEEEIDIMEEHIELLPEDFVERIEALS